MKEVLINSKISKIKNIKNKIIELSTPIIFSNTNVNIGLDVKKLIKHIKRNKLELFVFYGRLAKYKGIETLMRSIHLIGPKKLIVVFGKGMLEKFIIKEKNQFKNFLFFNRFISESEKKLILQNATAYLFPSV